MGKISEPNVNACDLLAVSFMLADIRDCIKELQDMGFDTEEFFTESSYVTRANNDAIQSLCTERGCGYFSSKLEPKDRTDFICEGINDEETKAARARELELIERFSPHCMRHPYVKHKTK